MGKMGLAGAPTYGGYISIYNGWGPTLLPMWEFLKCSLEFLLFLPGMTPPTNHKGSFTKFPQSAFRGKMAQCFWECMFQQPFLSKAFPNHNFPSSSKALRISDWILQRFRVNEPVLPRGVLVLKMTPGLWRVFGYVAWHKKLFVGRQIPTSSLDFPAIFIIFLILLTAKAPWKEPSQK